jgi:LCP family protein required for cell wall assembly
MLMAAPDRMSDLLAPPNPVDGDVRHARRATRSRGFVAALVVGALLLVGGGGVAAYFGYRMSLEGNMEQLDAFADIDPSTRPSAPPAGPTGPVNILVLGSDSRISAGDPTAWEAGAQRTDAIMLVHLAADRKSAAAISIPRDSWVSVPGYGEAKINAAFSYGGPALMIQTVENLTGVRIDHFAVTDFESFKALTDSLGGVEITVPDGNGGSVRQAMTGEEALEFTRERYALANGDFGRVQRQQAWMRAIVAKAKNSLSEPLTMARFLEAITSSVAVDEGLTLDRIQELFAGADGMATNDITFMTAPYSGTGRSDDGQSIVVLDRAVFDPLMEAVAKDEVPEFVATNPDAMDVLPAVVQ